MTNHIISIAAAGLFAIAGALPLSARSTAVFTDSPGLYHDAAWGTSRAEHYDVAAHLGLPQMVGTTVESVSFPWIATEGIADVRIWLSKELTVENKVSTPDIVELEAVYADGKMSATFPQPYKMEDGGVYVGISFTVEKNETQEEKNPVAAVKSDDAFGTGFWIHTSTTYGNRWKDISSEKGWLPVFEVTLADVASRAACLRIPERDFYSVAGEGTQVPMEVVSYGADPIGMLTLSDASGEFSGPLTMSMEGAETLYFGYPVECKLDIPAVSTTGCRLLELAVAEVNGEPNSLAAEQAPLTLYVCSSRPVHRPLFEEYTGTGCGYCPRGPLGMEKLAQMYGDRFVGVAYHVSDIMSIAATEDYPNYAPAQPDAFLDRYVQTDPYFGNDIAKKEFLVDDVWLSQEEIFATAHLSASCKWADDNRTRLEVTSNIQFVRDYKDVDFRMAYILVGDGLRGETPEWWQSNYYSGEEGKWPAEFDFLVEAPKKIPDVTYDHVALYMPEMRGVPGSLPTAINADEVTEHNYTLDLDKAVNRGGMSLIQDKDLLYVVAVILDASDGRVINSVEARPGESAVDAISSDASVAEYYTLQGVKTDAPAHGVFIEKRSDGTCRKVMIK